VQKNNNWLLSDRQSLVYLLPTLNTGFKSQFNNVFAQSGTVKIAFKILPTLFKFKTSTANDAEYFVLC